MADFFERMSIAPNTSRNVFQLMIRLLFEVLPTALVIFLTLRFVNVSFSGFDTGYEKQALYFNLGMAIAYSLYFFRARFIITFGLLLLTYWIIAFIIGKLPGEFDVFRAMISFRLYATLFIGGWIAGFLLARIRFAYIIISVFLAVVTLIHISGADKIEAGTADGLKAYFLLNALPVVAYILYMLFLAPVLANLVVMDAKRAGKLFFRIILFLAVVLLVFIWQTGKHKKDLQARWEKTQQETPPGDKGQQQPYDEKHGLLERGRRDQPGQKPPEGAQGEDDGEGGYRLKDSMSMSDRMSQADYIMFCSKLKNYFPDGSPKPLYFVYHYLTKYDPARETFTRDTAMPFNDELHVDPASLPMYRMRSDSTVIKNSLATKSRKVIEAEVYMSSNTWKHALLGPGGTFSCQSIPVDSSFGKIFRSAYKIKSYASDLNNAYFVYNPSANPMIEAYQHQRFEELREVENYADADSTLMAYYTQMPTGRLYDSIHALAARITKDAETPVDKVIAVRDFFLQTDKEGNRIFRYTLTTGPPGDPNIPNASMLWNFLFRTHRGYCTYYAGASIFLLRAAGIPCRFTTGFATIDRSDKNKGWYWFYASQAHAWTQVYFPEYGWLDFDMTIGNEDQREAPQPDGTPPLPPPEPWIVIQGKAATEATPAKSLDVTFGKIIFFNEDYQLRKITTLEINASVCRVLYGKKDTTLSAIQPGDSIFVVSYHDAAKQIPIPRPGVDIDRQVGDFPKPLVADEIHIKPKDELKPEEEEKRKKKEKPEDALTWQQILLRTGIAMGSLLLLILLIPSFIFLWLLMRTGVAGTIKKKADRAYRFALFHFHMAGDERGNETPLQYAENKIDPTYNAGFTDFMRRYLRLKYSSPELRQGDAEAIKAFSSNVRPAVRRKRGFFNVISAYFNLARAYRYMHRRPGETDKPAETELFDGLDTKPE
ncbi:MAG TPA: transglutaminase domain-containing protein [Bacteroidia bacterium]|nr:transglutaminase domain-containing protein [Bacteroidia bacterium]